MSKEVIYGGQGHRLYNQVLATVTHVGGADTEASIHYEAALTEQEKAQIKVGRIKDYPEV